MVTEASATTWTPMEGGGASTYNCNMRHQPALTVPHQQLMSMYGNNKGNFRAKKQFEDAESLVKDNLTKNIFVFRKKRK